MTEETVAFLIGISVMLATGLVIAIVLIVTFVAYLDIGARSDGAVARPVRPNQAAWRVWLPDGEHLVWASNLLAYVDDGATPLHWLRDPGHRLRHADFAISGHPARVAERPFWEAGPRRALRLTMQFLLYWDGLVLDLTVQEGEVEPIGDLAIAS